MSLLDCEPKLLEDANLKSRERCTIVEEIKGFLKVFKDGHVDRSSPHVQNVPPSPPSHPSSGRVVSKDVVIDVQSGIWARVYVPAETLKAPRLLPMVVYFHGGGFCMGSASWSIYDTFLKRLAMEANCLIISVNYRLAPEHRLPAQYEDGIKTLQWLLRHQEKNNDGDDGNGILCDWVTSCGDFSKCFLAGDSAGGNIVHNLTMMKMRKEYSSDRMVVMEGAILIQPFFGGMDELRWEEERGDPGLCRKWIDVYWRLALPVGAQRNHPACNPLPALRKEKGVMMPRMLVCVGGEDVLRERNMDYCYALVEAGINVRDVLFEGVGHAFHVLRPHSPRVAELMKVLSQFINTREA